MTTEAQHLPNPDELLSSANVVSAPKKNSFGPTRRSTKVLNRSTMIAGLIILAAIIVGQSGILNTLFGTATQHIGAAKATPTPPPSGSVSSILQQGEASNAVGAQPGARPGIAGSSVNGTASGAATTGPGAQYAGTPNQSAPNEDLNNSMGSAVSTMRNNGVNTPLVSVIHSNQSVAGVDPNTLMREQQGQQPQQATQTQSGQAASQVPAPSNDNTQILVASAVPQDGPQTDFGSSNIPMAKADATSSVASPAQLRSNNTLQFIASGSGAAYHSANEAPPVDPNEIFAGTATYWRLTSTIDTSHPGYIWAELEKPIRGSLNPYPIIFPAGTTLRGRADTNVAVGDSSVTVAWDLCTLPNGYTCDLGGMQGQDPDGRNGLSGQVNNHVGRTYTTVFLGTVLTAAAAAGNTGGTLSPSAGSSIAGAAAGNLANTANSQLQQNLAIPPSIVVPTGKDFVVRLESTIVNVRPYTDLTNPDH